jgi:hypothetical protein
MGPSGRCSREFGMKWRVMLELIGPDGIVGVHEVPSSGSDGVSGMVRSNALWISLPKPSLL